MIRQIGDPLLRVPTLVVEGVTSDLLLAIKEAEEECRRTLAHGVAGPQVGSRYRFFVWRRQGGKIAHIINPVIIKRSEDRFLSTEGCLSIPKKSYMVFRNLKVDIVGKDIYWHDIKEHGEELYAAIFQHEIDHLDGILLDERSKK